MVTPTNHVIARARFTLRGALGTLEIFATFFCKYTVGEDQKKSLHVSAGALAGNVPYYGKSGPGYCIRFKKKG